MKQRPVEPVHGRHPGRSPFTTAIRLAPLQFLRQIAAARRAVPLLAVRNRVGLVDGLGFRFLGALAPQLRLVLVVQRGGRGAVLSANVRHAEDGLPALKGRHAILRGRVAETGRGEGPFGPAVVDAGEVPVHRVRGGVAVELIADVDEVLDGCDVNVVDGGQVEDDGFKSWLVGFDGYGSTTARSGVVPGAILN